MSKSDDGLAQAKIILEKVMTELEIEPSKNTIHAVDGGYAWQISRGSADIVISLIPGTNKAAARLRIVSPLVKIENNISIDLAIKLLELNATKLPGIAFGLILKNMIVLIAERSVAELDLIEAQEMLRLIGYYGDKYDDLLVNEFGGTRVCDIG